MEYNFSDFLKSIEDLDFPSGYATTQREYERLERLVQREHRKKRHAEQDYRIIKYADQLHAFLFWFHSCAHPATLSDYEFLLIEPYCIKLVEKKNLKPSALDIFKETRQALKRET